MYIKLDKPKTLKKEEEEENCWDCLLVCLGFLFIPDDSISWY